MGRAGVATWEATSEKGWNVAFILGDASVEKEKVRSAIRQIRRAEDAIHKAKKTIAAARAAMKNIRDRVRKMTKDGTLRVLQKGV